MGQPSAVATSDADAAENKRLIVLCGGVLAAGLLHALLQEQLIYAMPVCAPALQPAPSLRGTHGAGATPSSGRAQLTLAHCTVALPGEGAARRDCLRVWRVLEPLGDLPGHLWPQRRAAAPLAVAAHLYSGLFLARLRQHCAPLGLFPGQSDHQVVQAAAHDGAGLAAA